MNWKILLSSLFFILVLFLLIIYFIFPENNFYVKWPQNANFSSYGNVSSIQFYPNMRFADKEITYSINNNCPLKKINDMEDAFSIIENYTTLSFNRVDSGGQILVYCSDQVRQPDSNGFFIAGEGGPTNITITSDYYIIERGKILLIRESECPRPNVEIHELLHALGFKHATNPDSIMYAVSKCSQVITNDITDEINRLYSVPSLPDLALENLSAQAEGRKLNISFNIFNEGLKSAPASDAVIYINDKEFKRYSVKELDVGYGITMNIESSYFGEKINDISVELVTSFEELNKNNNKIEIVTSS